MKLLKFFGDVIEDIFAMLIVPVLLIGLFSGGFAMAHFLDNRLPHTPHYELKFLWFKPFSWTAPESPYSVGLTLGQQQGAHAQFWQDQKNIGACLKREADRAQADQDAAVAEAKRLLQAQRQARTGRAREHEVQGHIDAFKGTGGACMQAEQMIREFVK